MPLRERHSVFHYKNREKLWGFLFALPGVIFFSLFFIFPILRTLQLSLFKWNILGSPSFIGFAHYEFMFNSDEFINSLVVTFYYVFGTVAPIWIIALGLALAFNRDFRGKDAYLMVYYLPVVISLTVWCILWRLMYHPSFGMLTFITDPLGFRELKWLGNPKLAMPSMILLSIWKGTPHYMVILLAGLSSIPIVYNEAAKIDGASGWQVFWNVTLPLLKPIILYVIIISTIVAFQVFVPSYILTNGGPGSATRVLPLFIYENAFKFLRMGYASGMSVILFAILMVFTAIQLKMFGFGKEE